MNNKSGLIGRRWFVVLLIVMLSVLLACENKTDNPPLERVTLQLKWVHQAQFAGFYLAREKGYYSQENLEVDFLEGGKDVDVLTSLVTGKAQFAVASSEVVLIQRQKESLPPSPP